MFKRSMIALLVAGFATVQVANAATLSTNGGAPGSVTHPARGACGPTDVTQSVDPNTVLGGFAVACFDSGNACTVANAFARSFNLGVGATAGKAYLVRCVEYGVDSAADIIDGLSPLSINMYRDTNGGAPNNANLVLLGTYSDLLPDGEAATLRSVPAGGGGTVLVPANSFLVVAWESEDLCTTRGPGNNAFNGANDAGQTGSSFIKAADCGLPDYLSLAAIGFPTQHIVMTLELEEVAGCCTGASCANVTQTDCTAAGGVFNSGQLCGTDTDGDGADDLCDNCDTVPNNGGPKSSATDTLADPTIPDADPGTCSVITSALVRVINVPQAGIVSDVNLSFNMTHSFYADINLTLSHLGTDVVLLNFDSPVDGSNFLGNYTIDDAGGQTFDAAAVAAGTTIPQGTYRGDALLSAFNGMSKQGDWTLTVNDTCEIDTGTLGSWSLSFVNAGPSQQDTDGDGVGDACDCGDGILVAGEECDSGAANGTPGSCCSAICRFVVGGTVCRASAGACDVAESCSGQSPDCPADAFAAAGTACGSGADTTCDNPDTCNGSGACNSNNEPAGTVCRASAGACDVAESCAGGGADCPADGFAAAGTACGSGSDTACDNPDTCNGSGACNSNNEPAGTLCRGAADVCDVAENCDAAGNCPADGYVAAGNVCRPAQGDCDVAENCDGMGPACPGNGFAPGSQECRPAAGDCDPADNCTGSGPDCPPNAPITACIDGDGCCPTGCTNDTDDDCASTAIPTVSEWGVAILALLLLVAGKLHFGRREETATA